MADISNIHTQSLRRDLIEDGAKCYDANEWMGDECDPKCLEKICRRGGLYSKSSLVWVESPHLKEAACRLIRHLTLKFPMGDHSLVETAIGEAVQLYVRDAGRLSSASGEVQFVNRLGRCADHLMENRVFAINESSGQLHHWDMWRQSLPDWLRNGGYKELFIKKRELVADVEKVGARTALMAALVSHRELGMIEMHKRWGMASAGDLL